MYVESTVHFVDKTLAIHDLPDTAHYRPRWTPGQQPQLLSTLCLRLGSTTCPGVHRYYDINYQLPEFYY